MISPPTINFVARHEGYSARPYRDGRGWTWGYGHWQLNRPYGLISRPTAKRLLESDLQRVQGAIVASLPGVSLAVPRLEALDDLVFNVGLGAWCNSTLRREILAHRWRAASGQFGRWVYSGGRVIPALVRRRAAEERLFNGQPRRH